MDSMSTLKPDARRRVGEDNHAMSSIYNFVVSTMEEGKGEELYKGYLASMILLDQMAKPSESKDDSERMPYLSGLYTMLSEELFHKESQAVYDSRYNRGGEFTTEQIVALSANSMHAISTNKYNTSGFSISRRMQEWVKAAEVDFFDTFGYGLGRIWWSEDSIVIKPSRQGDTLANWLDGSQSDCQNVTNLLGLGNEGGINPSYTIQENASLETIGDHHIAPLLASRTTKALYYLKENGSKGYVFSGRKDEFDKLSKLVNSEYRHLDRARVNRKSVCDYPIISEFVDKLVCKTLVDLETDVIAYVDTEEGFNSKLTQNCRVFSTTMTGITRINLEVGTKKTFLLSNNDITMTSRVLLTLTSRYRNSNATVVSLDIVGEVNFTQSALLGIYSKLRQSPSSVDCSDEEIQVVQDYIWDKMDSLGITMRLFDQADDDHCLANKITLLPIMALAGLIPKSINDRDTSEIWRLSMEGISHNLNNCVELLETDVDMKGFNACLQTKNEEQESRKEQ